MHVGKGVVTLLWCPDLCGRPAGTQETCLEHYVGHEAEICFAAARHQYTLINVESDATISGS